MDAATTQDETAIDARGGHRLDVEAVTLFLGSAQTDMLPIRMWGMMENLLDVRVAAISGLRAGLPRFRAVEMILADLRRRGGDVWVATRTEIAAVSAGQLRGGGPTSSLRGA